ncbi:hypothetical protein LUW77_30595 [Streptomyces radiopugnans]|nr:hypothetical protein LUW77_30595 [Streptomyces radiopugnans]
MRPDTGTGQTLIGYVVTGGTGGIVEPKPRCGPGAPSGCRTTRCPPTSCSSTRSP